MQIRSCLTKLYRAKTNRGAKETGDLFLISCSVPYYYGICICIRSILSKWHPLSPKLMELHRTCCVLDVYLLYIGRTFVIYPVYVYRIFGAGLSYIGPTSYTSIVLYQKTERVTRAGKFNSFIMEKSKNVAERDGKKDFF